MENKDMKRIFISHSTLDEDIAIELANFFLKLGISGDRIMCSSAAFSLIPVAEHIHDYLKEMLQEENLVILLLSDNYYASATCLNEMGAAWIRELPIIPILLKGFNIERVKGVVDKNRIMIPLGDKEVVLRGHFQHIKKMIEHYFDIQIEYTLWDYAYDDFIKKINECGVDKKFCYIDMVNVESFCIGEFHHEGCKIVKRDFFNKKIIGQIDYRKTKAYLCSFVFHARERDWTLLWNENKSLHFWIACDKNATCDVEIHFRDRNKSFRISLVDNKREFYIPLKQFEDYQGAWKEVKEVCFVFNRKDTEKNLHVEIEGIEIV